MRAPYGIPLNFHAAQKRYGCRYFAKSSESIDIACRSTALRIVNDVRTIFQRQREFVYIPDFDHKGRFTALIIQARHRSFEQKKGQL